MAKSKKTPTVESLNAQVEKMFESVSFLIPLCNCPKCDAYAIVALTPKQRLAQPDDTSHVCHPALGGCNHGFTLETER